MTDYKRNFNLDSLPPYLLRAEKLAEMSWADPSGSIKIKCGTYLKAKRFRQSFYSARNDMKKKIPYNNALMWQVEMNILKIGEDYFIDMRPTSLISTDVEIFAGDLSRKVQPEGHASMSEDDYEDELFALMEEISILKPPKKILSKEQQAKRNMLIELAAKDAWAKGHRAGDKESLEKLLRGEIEAGALD